MNERQKQDLFIVPRYPMKRVLFIAYHYPPIRAGAERAVRFTKHLPSFGYEPFVLTTSAFGGGTDAGVVRAWEPLGLYRSTFNRDARRTPSARTGGARAGRISGWVRSRLFIPDAQAGWMPQAIARGLRCVRREGIGFLVSTFPPASAHLAAMALKQMTGLPWLADFRDCWTYDPLDEGLTGGRLLLERGLEARVVRAADRIAVVTEVARRDFAERYPDEARKFVLIPNGLEPEEFPFLSEGTKARERGEAGEEARRNARMRMVHTGTFSRSHPRRSPKALFEAIRGMADPPELILVGALTDAERGLASDLIARGVVRMTGQVSRGESLDFQRSADLLVLADHPRQVRASNIPGKFFEYAATGRPILALAPDGATRDLICALKAGRAVPPDAPEEIRGMIEDFQSAWRKAGNLRSGVTEASLAPFHWRHLAGRLADTMDEMSA